MNINAVNTQSCFTKPTTKCLRAIRVAIGLAFLGSIAGCGSTPTKSEESATKLQPQSIVPTVAPVPQEATQKFEQALAQLESGQTETATTQLLELSTAYPNYSGVFLNLGIAQMKLGNLVDAEKNLQTASARAPQSPKVFNQLGILYRKLGRLKEADGAYQEALRLDPNYALAHLNLGVLCDLYLGQPERALNEYESYLALTSEPQPQVAGWVKELKARLGSSVPASPGGDVKAPQPTAKADS